MLNKVDKVKTTYSQFEVIKAFIEAWFKIYSNLPTKENIGIIFAQSAHESGLFKYCWNNNFGNIKAKDINGEIIKYFALEGTWEIVNGKKVILDTSNPGAWFKSYDSLTEGVKEYFEFLRNKRYKIAFTAVENGDLVGFATLLKKQRLLYRYT